MHKPSSLLFPEFTDRKTDGGKCRHDGAEQRVLGHEHTATQVVIDTKVDTERHDHRIQNNAQRQVDGHVAFVNVKPLLVAHIPSDA